MKIQEIKSLIISFHEQLLDFIPEIIDKKYQDNKQDGILFYMQLKYEFERRKEWCGLQFDDKREKIIISHCKKKISQIKRSRYWITKDAEYGNLKWILGFLIGFASNYLLFLVGHSLK